MRVYLTHCSAEKNPILKASGTIDTPDKLYVSTGIQQFMTKCQATQVPWAVLSDLYGVYWSHKQRGWYEKPPDTVTAQEEDNIVQVFNRELVQYDEIWFYVRPASFHPFYGRVLQRTTLANRVQLFQDLAQIVPLNPLL